MTTTRVASGEIQDVTLAAAATSGTPFLNGVRLVIPITSGAIGDVVACDLSGAHTVPKATGTAWVQNALLYWDDTAKNVTTVSTSNTLCGRAFAAAASGDTKGQLNLNVA